MKDFATRLPLTIDTPGLFFVEARARVARGKTSLSILLPELAQHRMRVASAVSANSSEAEDDAWFGVTRGVASLETAFGTTIREFAVADVLLVAAAESFINAVAAQVLLTAEADHFEKLSPVGKWLFLPKVMRLKWRHSLSCGPLQQFAEVAARRNRVAHPRPLRVAGIAEVDSFMKQLKLDARSAVAGVEAVKELMQDISLAWRGSSGPAWLDARKAANRPPCFIIGNVGGSGRLVRGRGKRAEAAT